MRRDESLRDRQQERAASFEKPAGFERLVEEYQKGVYGLAYRITGDPEAAWDIVQETFLRAFGARGRLHRVSNIRAWLFRVASNLSIDYLRRQGRLTQPEQEFWEMQEDEGEDPVSRAEDRETLGRIRAALVTLTDRERDAFLLKHWEGLKVREVAAVIGCREGTVKSLLNRAVGKLRRVLREQV